MERKRQGGLRIDPAVAAFQQQAAVNPATVTRKQRADRVRTRIHIDVDEVMKRALEQVAGWEREDTSLSQVCEMFLAYGLQAYASGVADVRQAFKAHREPARTPRFGWNVEIPETWLSEVEHFGGNGKVDGKVNGKD
jgi:hypothetical protein